MNYINQLNLSQEIFPLVCYNGAYGIKYYCNNIENNNAETVFCNPLNENQIRTLISFSEEMGLLLQVIIKIM